MPKRTPKTNSIRFRAWGRAVPDTVLRGVRARRESGLYVYLVMTTAWCALTGLALHISRWWWALVETFSRGWVSCPDRWTWVVWGGSVAVYLLLTEVGVAYLVATAWGSHRQLEVEGETEPGEEPDGPPGRP